MAAINDDHLNSHHPSNTNSSLSSLRHRTNTSTHPQPLLDQISHQHPPPSPPTSHPESKSNSNPPSPPRFPSSHDCHQPCSSTPPAQQSDPDEPLCRICLSGRDDEDPSLGRFIQPCLCRGTMAHIHVGCLQRWRTTSPSPQSFYRCDQCGYRYKLRRAKVAGLAENTAILGGVTFVVFFLLVTLAGFVAGWLLEGSQKAAMVDDSWDYGLGPFSYDSTGKIVGEVVGEAVRVLNSKLNVDGRSSSVRSAPRTKSNPDGPGDTSAARLKAVQSDQNDPHSYRYVKAKSTKLSSTSRESRSVGSASNFAQTGWPPDPDMPSDAEQPSRIHNLSTWLLSRLKSLTKHTIKGLAFIGVMSFFQLAMSVTLFSPWNFGIRNSLLRMMRSTHSRAGGRDPNGVASMLILAFVLLGLAKAIQGVWRLVRKVSQWALRKIEDGVLDVGA